MFLPKLLRKMPVYLWGGGFHDQCKCRYPGAQLLFSMLGRVKPLLFGFLTGSALLVFVLDSSDRLVQAHENVGMVQVLL